MTHHPAPEPEQPTRGPEHVVHVLASDLESPLGLINLICAVADTVGREVRMPADHSDLAAARQLLALLGLVEPAAEHRAGER